MATRARRDSGPLTADWKTHYEQLWKPVANPATQPVDNMPLTAFVAARQALRDALASFERVKPDCHTCAHYDMGRCKQFDSDIPKDFQETPEACDGWVFDGVPF